jgi:S1-C subfamily serine protease
MPRPKTSSYRLLLGLALLVLGVIIGVVWQGLRQLSYSPPEAVEPRAVIARGDLAADESATIELFRRVSPSVTYITSISLRQDWFTLDVQQIPRGTGSGFVWNDSGHVVTNYHVIEGASAARVTLYDRSTWDAEIVGIAPQKDLAVLRIQAPTSRLFPIAIGSSRNLLVGQKVFAIGNPFGLDQTLTTGVISALGREIESIAQIAIRDVIQIDAAINPGNSGGPLLDSAGRLIGVNTAIYSPSGAYAGIGFAIPANTVSWVVPELITKGRIERPTLGVELLTAQVIPNLDVEGALIVRVVPDSGADRAGLRGTLTDTVGRVRLGDVIVEVDGHPVRSSDDLVLALERRQAGEMVNVTVLRNGRRRQVAVELGSPER